MKRTTTVLCLGRRQPACQSLAIYCRSFSPWRPARPWPSRPLKGWMKPVLSCAKLALILYPTGHYKRAGSVAGT